MVAARVRDSPWQPAHHLAGRRGLNLGLMTLQDLAAAAQALHREFFIALDPAVFG
jgi:hypothetical protein